MANALDFGADDGAVHREHRQQITDATLLDETLRLRGECPFAPSDEDFEQAGQAGFRAGEEKRQLGEVLERLVQLEQASAAREPVAGTGQLRNSRAGANDNNSGIESSAKRGFRFCREQPGPSPVFIPVKSCVTTESSTPL